MDLHTAIILDSGVTILWKLNQEEYRHLWEISCVRKVHILKIYKFEKDACREMLEIRLANFRKVWIWNQYFQENTKWKFRLKSQYGDGNMGTEADQEMLLKIDKVHIPCLYKSWFAQSAHKILCALTGWCFLPGLQP